MLWQGAVHGQHLDIVVGCASLWQQRPWALGYLATSASVQSFMISPGRHNLRGYDAVHPFRRTYLRTAAALDLGNGYTPRHCPSLECER